MPGTFAQIPIAWQLFPFPPLEVVDVDVLDVVDGEPVVVGAVVLELVDDVTGAPVVDVLLAFPGRILMSEQARKFS